MTPAPAPATTDPLTTRQKHRVRHNLGLVGRVLRHAREGDGRGVVDYDDLFQEGVKGLMRAAQKFDGSRNVRFKTWAERRMRGRVLDYLRGLDPLKRRARDLLKAGRELGPRLAEALRVRTPRGYEDAGRLLADKKSGAGLRRVEDRDAVDAALSVLPRRTAIMVRLHYLHGWTHGRLARWMGVCEARVSQVLTRAMPPMRARLEGPHD